MLPKISNLKIWAHYSDPWWEEVLLLYVGLISDASLLLQKLVEHDRVSLSQKDIFYTRPYLQDVA